MLRKFLVLLMVWAVLVSPASCFDSFWHSEATRLAAAELGFSDDARKIMQLGNFSPDFFGPVADLASTSLPAPGLEALNQYLANTATIGDVTIRQETNYPWEGRVKISIDIKQPKKFVLRLRVPNTGSMVEL